MSFPPPTSAEDVIDQPARAQFEVFLDEHRSELNGCLDGLSEEQVRRSLVPSRTTLLGLVKHATFVEKVWFDEAVTCRSRAEIGIPAARTSRSFLMTPTPLPPSSKHTARHASHRAARHHPWGWTTCSSVTAAARSRCAGPTFTCCVNSHSTAGTRTSCGSSSSTSRPSDRSGGQLWTTPSAVNSTRTRVVTARRPWRMTTGTGKFRSGGTIALLVSDGPGLLTAR